MQLVIFTLKFRRAKFVVLNSYIYKHASHTFILELAMVVENILLLR